MNYDFVRYLGESLGSRVNAKLIYLFLAYQVTMSALVFLFDSGFPPRLGSVPGPAGGPDFAPPQNGEAGGE